MATTISAKVIQFLDKVLFQQTDLVTLATYKQHTGTTYDADLKRAVDMYADTSMSAVSIGDLTGANKVMRGEQALRAKGYVIRASEMPDDYLPQDALADLFVVDGVSYKVVEVEKILEVAYFVKVEF